MQLNLGGISRLRHWRSLHWVWRGNSSEGLRGKRASSNPVINMHNADESGMKRPLELCLEKFQCPGWAFGMESAL